MIYVNAEWLLSTILTLTRPLVREGAPQRQDRTFEKKISGQKSQIELGTKTYWLIDRRS
jgi:hypothetical protein